MKYILDTDTISYYLRPTNARTFRIFVRIEEVELEDLATTIFNYSEIAYGLKLKPDLAKKLSKQYKGFLSLIGCMDYDKEAADIFSTTKAKLKKEGRILPDLDLMIASVTIANDLTLVTHNTKHFSRIKDLKLEDWFY